jgi:hypothetical protein
MPTSTRKTCRATTAIAPATIARSNDKTRHATPEEFAEEIASLRQRAYTQLAADLSLAREIWQRCPQFVESKDFPEPYLSAYLAQHETHPDQDGRWLAEALAPDFEQQLPEMAAAVLRSRRRSHGR